MSVSKAQSRRETMERFQKQLDLEKARLATCRLPLAELIELFHCGNFFTELAALHQVHLLQEQDSETVMSAMLSGLQHPQWKVRRTCADFMDHWGDQRCVEPLLRILDDPNENVRRLAIHSLTCQECKKCPLVGDFVPHLIRRATTDRGTRVRRIATNLLRNYGHDERAVATLRYLSEPVPEGDFRNAG